MSPVNTSPLGGSGPKAIGQTTLDAIRRKLLALDSRIKYLEKNRTPAPLPMSNVSNASSMQQAQAGHSPTYSPYPGVPGAGYSPSPVLATMLFNMTGDLVLGASDPVHARYPCNVVGISADLSVFSSDVTFELLINGTTIQTVTMTSASTGLIAVTTHNPLTPYEDLVQVQTTSIGSGNQGLVVHVELGVDVNLPP